MEQRRAHASATRRHALFGHEARDRRAHRAQLTRYRMGGTSLLQVSGTRTAGASGCSIVGAPIRRIVIC